ncbi:imm11 family protein [Listeria booriae]|uniref:DUF1629 domain-containing protein n=5 Tax=Listeria booriae TaxID=1552123 RepID=A0A7X0ZWW6_9LIST|nr:DUF1629 domain-containing protein [Listeria booriae]MBC1291720.1 DUF1629 domain-containing protein [Listeria booriae]MBC1512094.1 DUF1629 domain-containing protein [Listeria booriae]MBC1649324.1 DUF1629 domain-containing protein [Listeria booriae]MBC1944524.1 DUF1629 domain-containing protein [Listeria booriae]MBC2311694.1 DUF1629 domain-containing protein [Listeria booriae]
MGFYKLLMDSSSENDIVCHYENDYGIQQYDLKMGKKIDGWNDNFEFYYDVTEGEQATDYLANDMGWLVVSDRLKTMMEELNIKAEFFSVSIREKTTNTKLNDYYVTNIIETVDALCLEESEYFETVTKKEGTIYTIQKYAVYGDKLVGKNMFKLPNRQEIPTFVSEIFKEEVNKKSLTGMEFLEIKVV